MRTRDPRKFELVEDYINNYKDKNGKAPSTYEIAAGTRLSKTTVIRYLEWMKEEGRIEYDGARGFMTCQAFPL